MIVVSRVECLKRGPLRKEGSAGTIDHRGIGLPKSEKGS